MLKLGASMEDMVKHAALRKEALFRHIYEAQTEADVRQAFLSLYELDTVGKLEANNVDYSHPELWIEFKYEGKFNQKDRLVRVLGQTLHYLRAGPVKHGNLLLPESFALADKNELRLYNTIDFADYICNGDYFEGCNPSGRHPDLEKALKLERAITSQPYHPIHNYNQIVDAFVERKLYDLA